MTVPTGVLLMAYGSPATLDDVEAYYTHIRGGRAPSPEAVAELRERYRRIGGRSPLPEITRRQAAGVQKVLHRQGLQVRTYVGMKHAPPFIADAVVAMAGEGVRDAVGVALAPHYSRMSIGSYTTAAMAAATTADMTMKCVESYCDHPGFIRALSERVIAARQACAGGQRVPLIFTAHSLPQRILQWDDPYPRELRRTCELVAQAAGIVIWRFAYQSASHTGEPWLGPDVLDVMRELSDQGASEVVISPVGFVADHLEVLYDLDVEAKDLAAQLGMRFVRARSLNDGEDFLAVLADLVRRTLAGEQLGSAARA